MARISPLAILPPVLFAAVAGLFLAGMLQNDPNELPSTLIGKPAPAVQVTPLGSDTTFDQSVLTQPGAKIVNFWASWCEPCRAEHPNLMTMSKEGIPIYGVNYKDDPAKAQRFLTEMGDPFRAIGADEKGRMAIDWGVYGVPESFVIDGNGNVVLRFPGPITGRILQDRIRPALEKASGPQQPDAQ